MAQPVSGKRCDALGGRPGLRASRLHGTQCRNTLRAGRLGAYSAAGAAGILLLAAIARGYTIPQFAQQLAGNFNVPAAALYAATLLLPALQGGLLAAGISRLLRAGAPATA